MTDALQRTTKYVVGACLALAALAFVFGGVTLGVGAAFGAGIAILNWFSMRWIAGRLRVASDRGKATWGTLLALKMLAVLGAVWLVLKGGHVDPLGFMIGMSGFVLGVLLGGFDHAAKADPVRNEEGSDV